MARTSFTLEDEVDDWIESRLAYGQSKAAFLRYCVETMQQVEPIVDQLYERHQYEKRQELIEAAVKKEVDRRLQEADRGSHSKQK